MKFELSWNSTQTSVFQINIEGRILECQSSVPITVMPDSLQNYTHIEFNKGCSGSGIQTVFFIIPLICTYPNDCTVLVYLWIRNAYTFLVPILIFVAVSTTAMYVVLIFALDLCQISLKMSATNFFTTFRKCVSVLWKCT